MTEAGWFIPDWPAPSGVRAAMSTRSGGVSAAPWASLNLGGNVGDSPAQVAINRQRWQTAIGASGPLRLLQQVHGRDLVQQSSRTHGGPLVRADGHWTATPNLPLVVQAADCLPVLLCDSKGQLVAAVHAGWRGLLAGILPRAVAEMRAHLPAGRQVLAWVGPGIGPCHFQVDAALVSAFRQSWPALHSFFAQRVSAQSTAASWFADLPGLAAAQLRSAGAQVWTDGRCTACEQEHFYSFRRDRTTGRMFTVIWRC